MSRIVPVILCGGGGKRLWPISRGALPKQFLKFDNEPSLFQQTVLRVSDAGQFSSPVIVANEDFRFIVSEQLEEIRVSPRSILLEPANRNTGPALAAAGMHIADETPNAKMLVLPSDHVMVQTDAFATAIGTALAGGGDKLVAFGIKPTAPDTGYGYIQAGAPLPTADGLLAISSFVEKPDLATAQKFLARPEYSWNSGIYLFPVQRLIEELERFEPELVAKTGAALRGAQNDGDFLHLAKIFGEAPTISIDHAVMERTQRAAVVPTNMSWADVGSWEALWNVSPKDENGNAVSGDAILLDCRNNYVRSTGPMVALLNLSDLVVVVTDDAVLVAPRADSQRVKDVVDKLSELNRAQKDYSTIVYRPWGHYESVQSGERYQVKRIMVKPGAQLSLQKHFHRAEHWVVVNGTAIVTRDNEEIILRENESTYLPLGCVHRLANPGKIPLTLIEVQSGAYLGEDDIVRFEDIYNRV
ncbi:mannose-1-phosphate guanylyltransferase/mannose-6-phosphate isomerase [Chelatococcus reniformis]|uniref:mannose-1-phosphate guanylyltransferase n=1 Tax=Chelatococcus reniformis TaxID=1494448 RepID=A0A916UEA2_9HYPH|nr:mannose-1-phosphate guanylyltransferase/mannose-6-phosphate isomerase [Chelatococcus reniformis]GGC67807.1 xanthan biosynthesis protein XanB [Chelatococcus reniformis]